MCLIKNILNFKTAHNIILELAHPTGYNKKRSKTNNIII